MIAAAFVWRFDGREDGRWAQNMIRQSGFLDFDSRPQISGRSLNRIDTPGEYSFVEAAGTTETLQSTFFLARWREAR